MSGEHVLVAGCGFVGLELARLLHGRGWQVTGCTHSQSSADVLRNEPFPVLACDISERQEVHERLSGIGPMQAIVHCASSGKGGAEQYRRVYLAGLRNLQDVLRPAYLVFTSSTSVYAQTGGELVTEDSPAEPDRETGRVLLEAEDFALHQHGGVARLAGIYGPGRSVLLRKFLMGEAVIEGDGARWVNQIHHVDAAAALATLVERAAPGIFNVCDDHPTAQRSLYEAMAALFDRPIPPSGPIDPNRKRGWTHKRVSNARLRSLGWSPRYPDFVDALQTDPGLVPAVGPI